jgi:hypothetical protein
MAQEKGQRRSAAEITEFAKILYYGPPGSGKTTDLASMANLGTVVHIDAESGLKPTALKRRGIEIANIESFPDRNNGETISYDDLDGLYWECKDRLEEAPGSIVGIMWDSVTETQKLLLETIVAKGVEKAERKGVEREPFSTYKEDWGVVTEQMRQLIRNFRDLPCHIGFAGLPRRDQDDDGTVKYGVAMSPALQTDLHGYVDVICMCEAIGVPGWKDGEMFIGRFRAGGKYEVKDRFGVLPTELVDPTMERVIQYINEELTADTDPVMIEAKEARQALAKETETQATATGQNRPARRPAGGKRPPPGKVRPAPEAVADADAEPEAQA